MVIVIGPTIVSFIAYTIPYMTLLSIKIALLGIFALFRSFEQMMIQPGWLSSSDTPTGLAAEKGPPGSAQLQAGSLIQAS